MTSKRTPAHVTTPIDPDTPGIEVADREPASWVFEIEFTPEEVQRLRAGIPRGPEGVTRFIKRVALEQADRQAAEKAADELRESA